MAYAEITQEQKDAIVALFHPGYVEKPCITFETREDGYRIKATQMYEYLRFINVSVLMGYMKIADILGCANGDELHRYSVSGCETCDYGSEYTWELKFW